MVQKLKENKQTTMNYVDEDTVYENLNTTIEKIISNLKQKLQQIQTGRPNINILDHVKLNYYGNLTPIKHVALVSVQEQTLIVKPYEANMTKDIVGAINKSDLYLNAQDQGNYVRVPIPPLNEEIRLKLIKQMHKDVETYKGQIRNARIDAKKALKHLDLSEDEQKNVTHHLQTLVDNAINDVETLANQKEKELASV